METGDQQALEESSPDSMPSVPQEKSREDIKVTYNGKQDLFKDQQKDSQNNQKKKKDSQNTAVVTAVKSKDQEQSKEKKKKQQYLYLCTTKCHYVVVKKACRQLGFKMMNDENGDWDIYWTDSSGITPEQLQKIQPYQRVNHFPGMYQLSRKNNLCRNIMRMQKVFKDEYNFIPKTWILPSEMTDFKSQFTKKKNNKTFIVKPVHLCQGKGIFLVRKFEDVDLRQGDQYVAQRYLHKPYLIDGLKFDLRIYALVYGVDPLRVFVFQEGLARFATEEYAGPQNSNLDNLYMHLTNYAIQKNSDNFQFNEGVDDDSSGHKRSLTAILDHIRQNEPQCDVDKLWERIQDNIAKTIIAIQPNLQHNYRSSQPEDLENSMCFEILGFDVIFDHKLRPYILEVNALASFGTDSPLDKKVKLDLMRDTFTMLNLSSKRKKQLKKDKIEGFNKRVMGDKGPTKFEKEQIRKRNQLARDEFDFNHLGNYKLVYPVLNDPEKSKKFEQYLDQSRYLWAEFTGGSKAAAAQQQLIAQKQNNQQNSNRAKTDPPGNKAKAQNLQQQQQLQKQNSVIPKNGFIENNNYSSQSNNDKVFIKRNTINGARNIVPQENNYVQNQQQQQQLQSSMQSSQQQLRSTGKDFNKTQITFHSHQFSNTNTNINEMILQSVTKQDTLESISINNYIESQQTSPALQVSQHPSANLSGLINFDFGISSTNLTEAIQKRFPMVRLEQQQIMNYPMTTNNQQSYGQNNQQNRNNGNGLSRMSYPTANDQSNYQNQQQVKYIIANGYRNSNESVNNNGLNSVSTAISNNSSLNNKGNTFYQHKRSQQKSQSLHPNGPANIGGVYAQQPSHFVVQNHNSSHVQNMERYNMLKHIEAVKRTINNPQLNMMKQKIVQKHQLQANFNDNHNMVIVKPIHSASIGRYASNTSKNQPHTLAEWLQLGAVEKKPIQPQKKPMNQLCGSYSININNMNSNNTILKK